MSSGNLILTVKHQRKPLNIRKKSLSIWVLPLSKQTLMRCHPIPQASICTLFPRLCLGMLLIP
ncbi:hypothetical protein NC651_027944 [Populus alba x Populus x berolinensis]|nr:hypothetical protein NC651_027944 [Populus alba x Populus x berolinensis]